MPYTIIPTFILSGFLGSGKTTLLNRALQHAREQGLKAAVLMNELGEINMDGALLDPDVPMEALLSGCICCTVRGDLAEAVKELAEEHRPDLLFIEATGAANPMEIVDAATDLTLLSVIRLHSLITVVDGPRLLDLTRRLGDKGRTVKLMKGQIRSASRLVLNKLDLMSPQEREELRALVAELNGHAVLLEAEYGKVDMDELLAPSVEQEPEPVRPGPEPQSAHACRHSHGEHHSHEHVMVHTLRFSRPVDRDVFEEALRKLPPSVLRAKGAVRFIGSPDRFMFQYAFGEPLFMAFRPRFEVPDAAVFIGEELPLDKLRELMAPFG